MLQRRLWGRLLCAHVPASGITSTQAASLPAVGLPDEVAGSPSAEPDKPPQAAASAEGDSSHAAAQRTFVADEFKTAPFKEQTIFLKKRYRGSSQKPFALQDARLVVDRNIPIDGLEAWLTEDHAAVALNLLSFFEIEHPSRVAIVAWTRQNIASFANPTNAVFASSALIFYASESERDATMAFIRTTVVPTLLSKLSQLRRDDFHSFVKLLHRCDCDDKSAWESICVEIKKREEELARRPEAVVRLFSCTARYAPDHVVTREQFDFIVSQIPYLRSYDFSAFISGVEKWRKASVADFLAMLVRLAERVNFFNARDLNVSFAATLRLAETFDVLPDAPVGSSTAPPGTILAADRIALAQQLTLVFDKFEGLIVSMMTPTSVDLYWRFPVDIISVCFTYEQAGRLSPTLNAALRRYVDAHRDALTHNNVASFAGVMRRSGRFIMDAVLRANLATMVGEHLGSFTIEETGHLALCWAATAATLAEGGPVISKLESHATKLKKALPAETRTPAQLHALLNCAAVFDSFRGDVPDIKQFTSRQLCETAKYGRRGTAGTTAALSELTLRLASQKLSAAELRVVARSSIDELRREVQTAVTDALQKATESALDWNAAHFDLVSLSTKLDKSGWAAKALAIGQELAVTPQQFVRVATTMIQNFPGSAEGIDFIKRGAIDLLKTNSSGSIAQYVALCSKTVSISPDEAWVEYLWTEKLADPRFRSRMSVSAAAAFLEFAKSRKLHQNDDCRSVLTSVLDRGLEGAARDGASADAALLDLVIAAQSAGFSVPVDVTARLRAAAGSLPAPRVMMLFPDMKLAATTQSIGATAAGQQATVSVHPKSAAPITSAPVKPVTLTTSAPTVKAAVAAPEPTPRKVEAPRKVDEPASGKKVVAAVTAKSAAVVPKKSDKPAAKKAPAPPPKPAAKKKK